MDLFSIKTIKELLSKQGAKPRKGLGQNFLCSKGVLGDILKAAQLTRSDTVLEIGPGIGTLTRELAQSAKKVIAVEKDPAMVQILCETTKDLPNVEIINEDILKLNLAKQNLGSLSYPHLSLAKFKVVANLPYYITSPVIRLFLEAKNRPELLVLMVQKEVAQRICARPAKRGEARPYGAAKPSLLSVSVQFYAKPEIVSYVKKSCFWPQPKVDSAILKIVPQNLAWLSYSQLSPQLSEAKFFEVVKAGFKQPRKQLLNNLASMLDVERLTPLEKRQKIERWLVYNDIQPTQRAETLSIEDWIKLAKDYTIYE